MNRPRTRNSNSWIVRSQPRPSARLRIFCFPYAGGGASIYHSWAKNLPDQIEVCAVQFPGRESRFGEAPFEHLELLMAALTQALPPYFDRPFVLFGHSFGALIGFELARALRRHELPNPAMLLVSGRCAPQILLSSAPIHNLPEADFISTVRAFGGTPKEVFQNAELRDLVLPTLRADFAINETYVYQTEPPLEQLISAFGGQNDDKVHPTELGAWSQQTSNDFAMHILSGDHFFLRSAKTELLQIICHEVTWLLS